MHYPPKRREENILTPGMLRTIAVTGMFFVVVMLALLLGMKGDPAHPGWFAEPEGRVWSVEVDGSRKAVPEEKLTHEGSRWLWDGKAVEVAYTVLQVSIFFSIYVFFQVWNQINSRSLTADMSGFQGLFRNPTFLLIAGTVAVGQVAIVTFGGDVFKVQPLGVVHWLIIAAGTASVLVFAEAARRVRVAMRKT
jgi:Ca2+-transporting ATPase